MKKNWLAGGLLLVLLAAISLGVQGSAAVQPPAAEQVAQPQSAPVAQTLAAVTQAKAAGTLVIRLEDCNSVQVREVPGGTLGFDGPADLYRTTIGAPSNGVTRVTVKQTARYNAVQDLRPVLTVPLGAYATVTVDADDSGVSLAPTRANYRITVSDSACSVKIGQDYTGTVDYRADDSSCSLEFAGRMQNATLNLSAPDCAISLPDGWTLDRSRSLTLTRGSGAAKLNVTFTDCAASVSEGFTSLDAEYANVKGTMAMAKADSGEAILGYNTRDGINAKDLNQKLQQYKAASTPNTVTAIDTIPAAGISALRVNGRVCGIAVEPSKSGQFELTYVGVSDPKQFSVTSSVKNGVLTVTALGKDGVLYYVCTDPAARVNTVRIGVPANVLKRLQLDCGTCNVLVSGLNLPIEAEEGNGMIRVLGDTLSKPISMESENGSLSVSAKSVTGTVSLKTENGYAGFHATTATGSVTASAENGAVDVTADRLDRAVLTAENGAVNAVVGTVGDNVRAGVENGHLSFRLTRAPTDLTFHIKSAQDSWYDRSDRYDHDDWDDWHDRYDHDDWDDWDDYDDWHDHDDWDDYDDWHVYDDWDDWYDYTGKRSYQDRYSASLPDGWYNGYTVGNGKPVLSLSAESGVIEFALGAEKK